jgi:hypothetical protein
LAKAYDAAHPRAKRGATSLGMTTQALSPKPKEKK